MNCSLFFTIPFPAFCHLEVGADLLVACSHLKRQCEQEVFVIIVPVHASSISFSHLAGTGFFLDFDKFGS